MGSQPLTDTSGVITCLKMLGVYSCSTDVAVARLLSVCDVETFAEVRKVQTEHTSSCRKLLYFCPGKSLIAQQQMYSILYLIHLIALKVFNMFFAIYDPGVSIHLRARTIRLQPRFMQLLLPFPILLQLLPLTFRHLFSAFLMRR